MFVLRVLQPPCAMLRGMARLIYATIASLDGYIEDESGRFDWAMPSDEVHAFVNDLERPIGTYLYGRRMYETMVFWESPPDLEAEPRVVQDFAELWQAADKIVYSRTLTATASARTRIERAFDIEAVRRLKASAERDISVEGPTSPHTRSGRGWSTSTTCSSRLSWWAVARDRFPTSVWISTCSTSGASTTASCTSTTARGRQPRRSPGSFVPGRRRRHGRAAACRRRGSPCRGSRAPSGTS